MTADDAGLSVRPPTLLRAIDPSTLTPRVEVGGTALEVVPNGDGTWRAVYAFTPNGAVEEEEVVVTWSGAAAPDAQPLQLARFTTRLPLAEANTTVRVLSDDYTTLGPGFDEDSDGFSNLNELNAETDPFDANSYPDDERRPDADVSIPWISPTDAPVIDGLYDAIWDRARYSNIDNLMTDLGGALYADGTAPYRWGAFHDDIYLYLFVLFDDVELGHRFGDSSTPWNDDNLNIHLDGNFSRGRFYDGIDDEQIMIRMVRSSGAGEGASLEYSELSAERAVIDWAVCLCMNGVDTWEVAIDLASAGIPIGGRPFGIDIQIDQDVDGGDRDAKWGWFHPSGSDTTWENPSRMGVGVLE